MLRNVGEVVYRYQALETGHIRAVDAALVCSEKTAEAADDGAHSGCRPVFERQAADLYPGFVQEP